MTRLHSGFTGTVARVGGAGATVEAGARWIRSDRERPVTLELSTSGLAARIHLTVWLNGRVVYQDDLTTDPQRKPTGKVAVNAILRAGENTLVVKSNHCNWQWQFSANLRGADGDDLADLRYATQPEPFASFHSLFESPQHGNGPDGRFDPCPAGADLFDLLSPSGIPGGH